MTTTTTDMTISTSPAGARTVAALGQLDIVAQIVDGIADATLIGMYSDLLGPRVNSGADTLVKNLTWLIKRTQLPIGASIAGFVFLQRFLTKSPTIRFREPMRPLVTVLLLGMKYSEDSVYSNATWASLIGVPVSTLNKCEIEFLHYLDFALYISPNDYVAIGRQADAFEAAAAAPVPVPSPMDISTPQVVADPAFVDPAAAAASAAKAKAADKAAVAADADADAGSNVASASTSACSSPTPKSGFLRRFMGAVKSSWRAD